MGGINTGIQTISGTISGTGSLTQQSTGTTLFTGNNTFVATSLLSQAGTLKAGSATAFGTTTNATIAFTSTTANNSTVDLGGYTNTFGTISIPTGVPASQTFTITDGNLTLGTSADLSVSTTGASKLDLSGLTSFTYNQPTRTVAVNNTIAAAVTAGTGTVLTLSSGTNAITANTINVGNAGNEGTAPNLPTATLDLGTANTLNIGGSATIGTGLTIGGYKNNGVLDFQANLTNPTATIRGLAGGTASAPIITVGYSNGGTAGVTGTADFSGTSNNGTVDAIVTNLYVAVQNSANAGISPTGTFTMASGIVNVHNLLLGTEANIPTGTTVITSNFNQNEGTVLANAVTFGNDTGGTQTSTLTYTSAYTLGTTGGLSGTLSASTIGIGTLGSTTSTTGSRATVNFNNGTISTYDPTLAQTGSAGSNGNSTTATDLTISGLTGGGASVASSLTLNIALSAGGTHNFSAGTGRTLTVASTALLSGTGGLNTTGPGTVVFNGTGNTYTGATNVNAGTLLVNGSIGTSSLTTVANGAVLGGGTNAATGTVGATTVNSGGTITAGTLGGYGTLTLASLAISGTYQADLSSMGNTAGDLLTITGALSGSGASLTLTGTPDGTDTYVLATFGSETGGANSVFTGTTPTVSGYNLVDTGTALELVPVPEPSTYVGSLVLVAALGWSVRGRFTRRSA